ncbi:MAG: hypothetical protein DCC58_05735 [Chloroflexi bacterium]|nr:MAG: hypothetical protein DCC58_05735 [Chloroflexota bacterium]
MSELETGGFVRSALTGMLSRRQVLRRAAVLGLSIPAIGTLLAACGGDDDDESPTATTGAGAATPTPAVAAPTPTIAPVGAATATPPPSAPTATTAAGATPEPEPTATVAPTQAPSGKPGGRIIIGINREPDNLDPAVTPFAVAHTVMMNIYDPLVWRGIDSEFYPGLATEWEIGADAMSFSFTLREGVTFHDGTPFNADAVKAFFDRVKDPATASGFASNLLGPYAGTEVIDETHLTVTMTASFAPALDGMSQAFLGITSPTAQAADPTGFLKNPVGTGFMKFVEWVDGDHILMERNEDYNWASPYFSHEGPAYLEEVEFRFFPDHPTRLAALEAGDVNMIEQLPDAELARFMSDSNYQVQLGFSPGVPSCLMMNTKSAPLDDVNVRRGIASAVDRQELVEVANFNATKVAWGPLWEGTPFYSSEVEKFYPFDLEAAGAYLDEAGWTMGSDGIREKDGQKLNLLWVMGDAHAHYAELLQAQLRAAGIGVELSKAAPAAVTEAAQKGTTQLSTVGWISSDPVVLSNIFHSKNEGAWNLSHYENPELDAILDAGEATSDPTERQAIYTDAQVMIMEEALIVPMWGIHRNNAVEAKYKDMKRDIRTYIWLYDAWVDE